jgi:hypothetical protein
VRFVGAAAVDAILAGGKGGLNVAVLLKHRKEVQVFINKDHTTKRGGYSCGRGRSESVLGREAFDSLATNVCSPRRSTSALTSLLCRGKPGGKASQSLVKKLTPNSMSASTVTVVD